MADWFARSTYSHDQFADVTQLSERKRELDLSLTVVLPAREVAGTIGEIIDVQDDAAVRDLDQYLHALCPADGVRLEERTVQIVDRPPMVEATGSRADQTRADQTLDAGVGT